MTITITNCNASRWRTNDAGGHYESFWLRANHPTRALAFWIRYTVFSPRHRPQDAIGELWAIWSDGAQRQLIAVKREVPISNCRFSSDRLDVVIADAVLHEDHLKGWAEHRGHRIEWNLRYGQGQAPLFHLPQALYTAALPKAKSLVSRPLAAFNGQLVVDGETIAIENWIGSQNHNWGSQHTDRYAYGQVAGFDNAPDSFLEIATARIRVGPVVSPPMTPLVLRHDGETHALNSLGRTLLSKGRYGYFNWTFSAGNPAVRIDGRIQASPSDFVGLRYYNPPGGDKCCLNSKLASCELTLTDKRGSKPVSHRLYAKHRVAFELLSDDFSRHGVAVQT